MPLQRYNRGTRRYKPISTNLIEEIRMRPDGRDFQTTLLGSSKILAGARIVFEKESWMFVRNRKPKVYEDKSFDSFERKYGWSSEPCARRSHG